MGVPGLRRTSTSLPAWISKFLVPVGRLLVAIPDLCFPSTKAITKTRISAMTKRARTRGSTFQDGEDVDVLRSPGVYTVVLLSIKTGSIQGFTNGNEFKDS